MKSQIFGPLTLALLLTLTQGCSTAQMRESQRKKDVVFSKYGFSCDFVKTDSGYDMEAELTNRMVERCDSEKPFSVSPFVTATDVRGMIFCCSIDPVKAKARAVELKSVWAGGQGGLSAPEPKPSPVAPGSTLVPEPKATPTQAPPTSTVPVKQN